MPSGKGGLMEAIAVSGYEQTGQVVTVDDPWVPPYIREIAARLGVDKLRVVATDDGYRWVPADWEA